MELKQLYIMIHKRFLYILGIPILIATVVALISLFLLTPIYEATSTLYILNQKSVSEGLVAYDQILANQYLVKDYRELIKSKLITKEAIMDLGITTLAPETLSKNITVESKNNTSVLEIRVEDTSPVRAAALTNQICNVFKQKSTDLLGLSSINVIDVAEVPIEPVKPNILLGTLLAYLIGLLTTLGLFYLLELINETIKTSEDIDTYLGLNVLGTIPTFSIK